MSVKCYVDESCHLENDGHSHMTLGLIACDEFERQSVVRDLRTLKSEYGLRQNYELKWGNVSPAKFEYYIAVATYFLSSEHLEFRALVAEKSDLRHARFNQTHEDWYYKMIYQLVLPVIQRRGEIHLLLDKISDTENRRIQYLAKVFENTSRLNPHSVRVIEAVDSRHSELIQLSDFLLGAVSYKVREQHNSESKLMLANFLEEQLKISFKKSTPFSNTKFNIFHWRPQGPILRNG